jgi:two-component system OmpR family sensor kinase
MRRLLSQLPRLPRLSSRSRATLRVALAVSVLWFLGGNLVQRVVRGEMLDRIDVEGRAESLGAAAAADTLTPDVIASARNENIVGSRDGALLILGPTGPVAVFPAGPSDDPEPLPDIDGYSLADLRGRSGEPFTAGDVAGQGDRYRVVTAPMANGDVVVAAKSLDPVREMEEVLARALTIGGLTSIGFALVLVWLINRQTLKPLEEMIDTAQAVGAGSLDTRVELQSSAPDAERLGEAMNNMLERLQEAFADKELSEARLRQFVADASHELRTPLAAVLGYAELYQEGIARNPDQVDRAIERIIAEGTRMRSLVEDLLLLARLDEGRQLARDAVDLTQVADDAVTTIRTTDRSHDFVREQPGEAVDVIGDAVALRQIIDNLLANVVAHTPDGTGAAVSVGVDGPDAVLVVDDDGPGMSPDSAARAFDRFWRAERGRSRPGGSGLGLAIVAELVHAHGGTISLDSSPRAGCRFTIRLPRASATNNEHDRR